MTVPPSESEVRAMRDLVYGKPITDKEWQSASKHWMLPEETEWLRQMIGKT